MGTATLTVCGLLTWPLVATTTGPEMAPSGTRATRKSSELTTMRSFKLAELHFRAVQFLGPQAGAGDPEFASGQRQRGRDGINARSAIDVFLAEDAVGKSHESPNASSTVGIRYSRFATT